MIYTVYVLFSQEHQKIYIGYTSNLLERFKSHQTLGKDWTARYRPWIVIYCEYYLEKSQALNREKKLKQYRNRLRIHNQIHQEKFQQLNYISI